MELLYLWIEDYKNIKQQGFNFSPLYDFEFKPTKEVDGKVIEGTLTDKMNPKERETKEKFYKDFFNIKNEKDDKEIEKGKIMDVTAVVGENGAGKSSVLEYLLEIEVGEDKSVTNYSYLMVYSCDKLECKKANKLLVIKKLNYSLKKIKECSCTKKESDFPRIIYYSDTLYHKTVKFTPNKVIDLSINKLIPDYVSEQNFQYNSLEEAISLFDLANTSKLIHFCIEHEDSIKDLIQIPNKVFITIKSTEALNNNDLNLKTRQIDRDIFKIRTNFNQNKQNSKQQKLIHEFKYGLAKNLMYYLSQTQDVHNKEKFLEIEEEVKNIDILFKNQNLFSNIDIFTNFIESFSSKINKIKINSISNKFKVDEFYIELKDAYDLCKAQINYFRAIQEDKNYKKQNLTIRPILSFSWRNMSAGETSLLSLLARLYDKNEQISGDKILLLIDEGELGLHPQWQKQYLKILLETLPKIFLEKQIQLILTSHSPFLVSDLPKENVIFLEKEKDTGKCKVSKLDSMKETFGANIHTLLTDSFFMKGGLVGEFAQTKIDEVIKYLNNEHSDIIKDNDTAQSYIDLIGEPIVKTMLRKLLDSKRLRKVDEHEEKLKGYEDRIQKLESEIKKLKK